MGKKTTIGGQALIEGILMRGPKKTAIVVRKSDGELVIKEEDSGTSTRGKLFKLPVMRGIFGFWDQLKYGIGAINYSASFFEEDDDYEPGRFEKWLDKRFGSEKIEKFFMGFATVFGIAVPIVLFFLLPTLVAGFFGDGMNRVLRNLIEGFIRILIFLAFIISTSKMKDIRRTYMYHGAEHKSIWCYESGEELTVENVKKHTRFHPRCGTSFLFVIMIISILFFSLFTWSNPYLRVVLRLALLPLIVGVGYEINRFVGRHDNWLSRLVRVPGMFLQRFTTFEPEDAMIEVAIEGLKRVIPENDNEDKW